MIARPETIKNSKDDLLKTNRPHYIAFLSKQLKCLGLVSSPHNKTESWKCLSQVALMSDKIYFGYYLEFLKTIGLAISSSNVYDMVTIVTDF